MNLALYGIDGFHQDSTLIAEDVLREAGIIIIMMMPAPGPGPPGLSDRNDLRNDQILRINYLGARHSWHKRGVRILWSGVVPMGKFVVVSPQPSKNS